jgi:hypothetical protein
MTTKPTVRNTGENFYLVAPRVKRMASLTRDDEVGKLPEILFNRTPNLLIRLLTIPEIPPVYIPGSTLEDQHPTASSSNTPSKTNLSHLPTELHLLIVSLLTPSIEDILSLALTCRYFWTICWAPIHTHFANRALGLWARDQPIICAGEFVEVEDFPPECFTKQEIDSLRARKIIIHPSHRRVRFPKFMMFHFKEEEDFQKEKVVDLRRESLFAIASVARRGRKERDGEHHDNDPAFRLARKYLVVDDKTYFAPGEKWMLRNWTTKEFVRAEALAIEQQVDLDRAESESELELGFQHTATPSDTDSDTQVETESETEPDEPNSGTDTDLGSCTQAETESSEPVRVTETDKDTDTPTEIETKAESGTARIDRLDTYPWSLGHAVLSRICWTTWPGGGLPTKRLPLHLRRGVWAGHRFDITTWRRHVSEAQRKNTFKDEDEKGEEVEWKDVSDEVRKEMDEFLEMLYGEN